MLCNLQWRLPGSWLGSSQAPPAITASRGVSQLEDHPLSHSTDLTKLLSSTWACSALGGSPVREAREFFAPIPVCSLLFPSLLSLPPGPPQA